MTTSARKSKTSATALFKEKASLSAKGKAHDQRTTGGETAVTKPALDRSKSPFRTGSRGDALHKLLIREKGATLDEMIAATGWQAHSIRGFLSGALKKKHRLTIESTKREDGARLYRVAS